MNASTERAAALILEGAGFEIVGAVRRLHDPVNVRCNGCNNNLSISPRSVNAGHGCKYCKGHTMSHEQVNAEFKQSGWELLSHYSKAKEPLLVRCPQRHERTTTWDSFRLKRSCPACDGTERWDKSQFEQFIEAEGYKVDPRKSHKEGRGQIFLICPKGHHWSTSFSRFKSGVRCGRCTGRVLSVGDIREEFESSGWELVSAVYSKNSAPLEAICPNGHRVTTTWAAFSTRSGTGCRYCSKVAVSVDDVGNSIRADGYAMLSPYKTAISPLILKCPKGHKWETTWNNFQQGGRCSRCSGRIKTQDDAKAELAAIGLEMRSPYQGFWGAIKTECTEGHAEERLYASAIQCGGCGTCARGHASPGGFKPNKPGALYYVRFTVGDRHLYKIGITNLSVSQRFIEEKLPMKVIKEERFLFGFMAQEKELKILRKYKKWRYDGPPLLKYGDSELFVRDVLGLDNAA
jgi:hypothetical protein